MHYRGKLAQRLRVIAEKRIAATSETTTGRKHQEPIELWITEMEQKTRDNVADLIEKPKTRTKLKQLIRTEITPIHTEEIPRVRF
jgi:hypothetical protein